MHDTGHPVKKLRDDTIERARKAECKALPNRHAHTAYLLWKGTFLGSLLAAVTVWFDNPEVAWWQKLLICAGALGLCALAGWRGGVNEQRERNHEEQLAYLRSAHMYEREADRIARTDLGRPLTDDELATARDLHDRADRERGRIRWEA